MIGQLLWVWIPYASLAVFAGGHIWRYRHDRFSWSDTGMQLFRPRALRWGIVLFHLGAVAVIAGHFLGILVPAAITNEAGVSESSYRLLSSTAGTLFGIVAVIGLAALIWRRTRVGPVVANTSRMDLLTLVVLALVILLGMVDTIGVNLAGGGYDYRSTIAVWFRGILVLEPHTELMESVPLLYQLHTLAAWLVIMLWPFSRLVHLWYFPFWAGRRVLAQVPSRKLDPGAGSE